MAKRFNYNPVVNLSQTNQNVLQTLNNQQKSSNSFFQFKPQTSLHAKKLDKADPMVTNKSQNQNRSMAAPSIPSINQILHSEKSVLQTNNEFADDTSNQNRIIDQNNSSPFRNTLSNNGRYSQQFQKSGRSTGTTLKPSKQSSLSTHITPPKLRMESPKIIGSISSPILTPSYRQKFTGKQSAKRQNTSIGSAQKQDYNTQMCNEILQQSGLQIHPKQLDMLNDQQIQQLINNIHNHSHDDKIQQIISSTNQNSNLPQNKEERAGNGFFLNNTIARLQKAQNTLQLQKQLQNNNNINPNQSHAISVTQQKFEQELQSVIQANLKEQLAQKIAQEIQMSLNVQKQGSDSANQQQSSTEYERSGDQSTAAPCRSQLDILSEGDPYTQLSTPELRGGLKNKKRSAGFSSSKKSFTRKQTLSNINQRLTNNTKQVQLHHQTSIDNYHHSQQNIQQPDPMGSIDIDQNYINYKKDTKIPTRKKSQNQSNKYGQSKQLTNYTKTMYGPNKGEFRFNQVQKELNQRSMSKNHGSFSNNKSIGRTKVTNSTDFGNSYSNSKIAGRHKRINQIANTRQQLNNKNDDINKISPMEVQRFSMPVTPNKLEDDRSNNSPSNVFDGSLGFITQKIKNQIDNEAKQLTEKMKQMSVYDFYQMTANQKEDQLLDVFIKQQLFSGHQNKLCQSQQFQILNKDHATIDTEKSPGVAPKVNIDRSYDDGQAPKRSISQLENLESYCNSSEGGPINININCLQQPNPRMSDDASVIVETNEEHIQSISIRNTPQRESQYRERLSNQLIDDSLLGKNFNSPPREPKSHRIENKSSPRQSNLYQEEQQQSIEVQITQMIQGSASRLKNSLKKSKEQNKSTSSINKYLDNINKRYVKSNGNSVSPKQKSMDNKLNTIEAPPRDNHFALRKSTVQSTLAEQNRLNPALRDSIEQLDEEGIQPTERKGEKMLSPRILKDQQSNKSLGIKKTGVSRDRIKTVRQQSHKSVLNLGLQKKMISQDPETPQKSPLRNSSQKKGQINGSVTERKMKERNPIEDCNLAQKILNKVDKTTIDNESNRGRGSFNCKQRSVEGVSQKSASIQRRSRQQRSNEKFKQSKTETSVSQFENMINKRINPGQSNQGVKKAIVNLDDPQEENIVERDQEEHNVYYDQSLGQKEDKFVIQKSRPVSQSQSDLIPLNYGGNQQVQRLTIPKESDQSIMERDDKKTPKQKPTRNIFTKVPRRGAVSNSANKQVLNPYRMLSNGKSDRPKSISSYSQNSNKTKQRVKYSIQAHNQSLIDNQDLKLKHNKASATVKEATTQESKYGGNEIDSNSHQYQDIRQSEASSSYAISRFSKATTTKKQKSKKMTSSRNLMDNGTIQTLGSQSMQALKKQQKEKIMKCENKGQNDFLSNLILQSQNRKQRGGTNYNKRIKTGNRDRSFTQAQSKSSMINSESETSKIFNNKNSMLVQSFQSNPREVSGSFVETKQNKDLLRQDTNNQAGNPLLSHHQYSGGQVQPSKQQNVQLTQELKQIRIKLEQTLNCISLAFLRELNQIVKPQKHMYFAGRLFMILYEFVRSCYTLNFKKKWQKLRSNLHANRQNEANHINKVGCDIYSDNTNGDADLDVQIFNKIIQRYFEQGEEEMIKLQKDLIIDNLKIKDPSLQGIDKHIQNEWNNSIKPFLGQQNIQFVQQIQGLSKQLKKLLENVLNPSVNLEHIQRFGYKIQAMINAHQSIANSCNKNLNSLFGKTFEIVNQSSQYMIKKSLKEIDKIGQVNNQVDQFDNYDGFDQDKLIEMGGLPPNYDILSDEKDEGEEVYEDEGPQPQMQSILFNDPDYDNFKKKNKFIQDNKRHDSTRLQIEEDVKNISLQIAQKLQTEVTSNSDYKEIPLVPFDNPLNQTRRTVISVLSDNNQNFYDKVMDFRIKLMPVDYIPEAPSPANESSRTTSNHNQVVMKSQRTSKSPIISSRTIKDDVATLEDNDLTPATITEQHLKEEDGPIYHRFNTATPDLDEICNQTMENMNKSTKIICVEISNKAKAAVSAGPSSLSDPNSALIGQHHKLLEDTIISSHHALDVKHQISQQDQLEVGGDALLSNGSKGNIEPIQNQSDLNITKAEELGANKKTIEVRSLSSDSKIINLNQVSERETSEEINVRSARDSVENLKRLSNTIKQVKVDLTKDEEDEVNLMIDDNEEVPVPESNSPQPSPIKFQEKPPSLEIFAQMEEQKSSLSLKQAKSENIGAPRILSKDEGENNQNTSMTNFNSVGSKNSIHRQLTETINSRSVQGKGSPPRSSKNPYILGRSGSKDGQNIQTHQPFSRVFRPQYGYYHPNTGIPVYSIDDDFSDYDEFSIRPIKIRGSDINGRSPAKGHPSPLRSPFNRTTQADQGMSPTQSQTKFKVRQRIGTREKPKRQVREQANLDTRNKYLFPVGESQGPQQDADVSSQFTFEAKKNQQMEDFNELNKHRLSQTINSGSMQGHQQEQIEEINVQSLNNTITMNSQLYTNHKRISSNEVALNASKKLSSPYQRLTTLRKSQLIKSQNNLANHYSKNNDEIKR